MLNPLLAFAVSTDRVLIGSPLGFLIGLSLGALGGGGSILAVPLLVYVVGQTPKESTTTSLLTVGAAALIGMLGHLRAGRVRVRAGLTFGLAGVGGSFAGSELNALVPANVLLLAFSGLMLLVGWRMWCRAHAVRAGVEVGGSATMTSDAEPPAAGRSGTGVNVRVILVGTCVGFATGFFGIGGGFVIVPGLVLALGYEVPIAVGTSLLVIVVSSVEALGFRLATSAIDWEIVAPFIFASIIGVLVGNVISGWVPAPRLNLWFVWLISALALYTMTAAAIKLF